MRNVAWLGVTVHGDFDHRLRAQHRQTKKRAPGVVLNNPIFIKGLALFQL